MIKWEIPQVRDFSRSKCFNEGNCKKLLVSNQPVLERMVIIPIFVFAIVRIQGG